MKHQISETLSDPISYEACMAQFFELSGLMGQQPQGVSDRASDLVLNAIVRYPQTNVGAELLLANKLLGDFDSQPHSATGIGMREMACIIPDPSGCAERVNKIHKGFGIPVTAAPGRAAGLVCYFAASALDAIERSTRQVAAEKGVSLPTSIVGTRIINEVPTNMSQGPWVINRPAAFLVHAFLAGNPRVRTLVSADIQARADRYRADSRNQQARAQASIAMRQTLGLMVG